MKYISLFSGIGGFDLGFDRAGMECVLQVEKDEKARAVLKRHWPDVPKMELVEDVTRGSIRQLGIDSVDLICGGFPCQDISLSSTKQAGLNGKRSGLWFEMLRIISEIKPKWVVGENVSALLTVNSGRDFGTVLSGLAQIGYDAEWDCLPAAAFGAPHRRDRVFIVAYPAGQLRVDRVLWWGNCQEIDDGQWQTSEWGTHRKLSELGAKTLSGLAYQWQEGSPSSQVCRMVDGLPAELDRLGQLGNAIVPQVAEWIGRRIVEIDNVQPVQPFYY
jgi:DNA (cytosine-5)-methyltransferase 1